MRLTDIPVRAGKAKESEGYFLCGSPQLEQPCISLKHRSSCEDQRLTQDSINPPFHVSFGPPPKNIFMAPFHLKEGGKKRPGLSAEWQQQQGSSSLGDNALSLAV